MLRTAGLCIVVLALLTTGCGGSEAKPTVDKPATVTAKPKPKPDPDVRIARELRSYMRKAFGPGPAGSGLTGADWYNGIKGYTVNGGDVSVATDVYPDSDAPPIGQRICAGLISASLPLDDPTIAGLTGARVLDSTGGIIKRCERAGSTDWTETQSG